MAEYRGPTFPQFRPNSDTSQDELPPRHPSYPSYSFWDIRRDDIHSPPQPQPEAEATVPVDEKGKTPEEKPSQEILYKYWKEERAPKEADSRGGWGRLSFEEFKRKVKALVKEGKGNQMDYLGSWIDFCIP
jgi:hypothetical protein